MFQRLKKRPKQRLPTNMSSGATGGILQVEGGYSSPIQGVKMVVSNLKDSVTEEDLGELFGELGNVKKVNMKRRGVAEIVFVKRKAAEKAVEMYNKVLLDGRAMKCTI